MSKHELVLVLDFGGQYTQLIARRIRENGVYSEIIPFDTPPDEIRARKPIAIVLSGGPSSVYDEEAPICSEEVIEMGVPVLGICYGMNLLCKFHGGEVSATHKREYGRTKFTIEKDNPLFDGLEGKGEIDVWMSHGDKVEKLPDGFERIGYSENSEYAAIRHKERDEYGLQFHPEVMHTDYGKEILDNFVKKVSGAKGDWTSTTFVEDSIEAIRNEVGDEQVLCAVSGGVDSSVMAVLLDRALGDQVTCVLIDTGLMRLNEATDTDRLFHEHTTLKVKIYERSERFLSELAGVTDPEKKRKIIGRVFIEVFEEIAESLGEFKYLAQGTLYPDVIESTSVRGPSETIKSHHNVGGLPEKMNFKLVEPLRELFKDEVRAVGRELGLPNEVIGRHPFPGPGLAVRIPGEVTTERADILRQADAIFIEELHRSGWYDKVWQALSVLLPINTVGVMGDSRTYANVLALRAVTSVDGMTADWARLPDELLGRCSERIINEVSEINRVVYDISSKPPGTIEWE